MSEKKTVKKESPAQTDVPAKADATQALSDESLDQVAGAFTDSGGLLAPLQVLGPPPVKTSVLPGLVPVSTGEPTGNAASDTDDSLNITTG